MTTIATLGAGLIASCHVNNQLGTYIVWLLVGAGPMMSLRKAIGVSDRRRLRGLCSGADVGDLGGIAMAHAPFSLRVISFTTYLGTTFKLGAPNPAHPGGLPRYVSTASCLRPIRSDGPRQAIFGGSVIAFGTIIVFDNWIWPDRGEAILMESLGASVVRAHSHLLEASNYYLDRRNAPRPPLPPPTSDLPGHMDLLNRSVAEGVSAYRQAILLAAITRVARINLEVERMIFVARPNLPGQVRAMVRPELQATVDAIATVLDEMAHELPTHIIVGADQPPSAARARARSAMDALAARILQVRPTYIRTASPAEVENFAAFTDSLAVLTGYIDHHLDAPPPPPDAAPAKSAPPRIDPHSGSRRRPLCAQGRRLRGARLCDRHR